jgi:hypothetical protein
MGKSTNPMYKLGRLENGEWIEHTFPRVFTHEATNSKDERLVIGVPSRDVEVFKRLVVALTPPYLLLYVLHTPRGESEPGRYQSDPVSREQFASFITRFGSYLISDARFDLWAHSPGDAATIVLDRHNRIFAYGSTARLVSELEAMDFVSGSVEVPSPHEHHYREECDVNAAALLSMFDWKKSPLRPEDEQ